MTWLASWWERKKEGSYSLGNPLYVSQGYRQYQISIPVSRLNDWQKAVCEELDKIEIEEEKEQSKMEARRERLKSALSLVK
jgi:hypothetical protein